LHLVRISPKQEIAVTRMFISRPNAMIDSTTVSTWLDAPRTRRECRTASFQIICDLAMEIVRFPTLADCRDELLDSLSGDLLQHDGAGAGIAGKRSKPEVSPHARGRELKAILRLVFVPCQLRLACFGPWAAVSKRPLS